MYCTRESAPLSPQQLHEIGPTISASTYDVNVSYITVKFKLQFIVIH